MKPVASCRLPVTSINHFSFLAFRFLLSAFLHPTSCCLFLLFANPAFSQTDIPIATWRLHLSYNTIKSVVLADDKVYGATESGILVFNKEDNSLSSYNTLNGLSGTGISTISFDAVRKQLLIAYTDGNLDIIKNNEIINFNRIKKSTTVTGSKKINHISINGDFAYLSTDYGVVIFNLLQLELKETWRDLGASGKKLKIFESTFLNDSIFIATEKGVLAGDTKDNLLDFNNWKRFDAGNFSTSINSVVTFNTTVYISIDEKGIFRYENGQWVLENFLQNQNINFLRATSNHLLIGENSNLWMFETASGLNQITTDKISFPITAVEDAQQKLWVGDEQNGLVADFTGNFESYIPNGPTFTSAFRLKFNNGILYALPGGFTTTGTPLGNAEDLNFFESGSWKILSKSLIDLTDIDFINSQTFLSSFGSGMEKTDAAGDELIFDDTNSPLENVNPPAKSVFISAIESSADGLWVANYGANKPLHFLQNDNAWQSFSLSFSQAKYPQDLVIDFDGNLWVMINAATGGGLLIFNKEKNTSLFRSEIIGNGALPSRLVHALAVDREGFVWAGTSLGVAYFFSAASDAVKPIFENRFLLKDEKITAIEVDGGNRKWIGTEKGVWLFNPTGEELIYNFTEENSPLLSNKIIDIEINDQTGEVFFSTDKGMISYRADATASKPRFQTIKIFPNPVTADFSGMVGITGLATDAFVKITDISGKLIWQTQANGGTATWNIKDYNGRRASTGIYLVFAATENGGESVVGKIAVVD